MANTKIHRHFAMPAWALGRQSSGGGDKKVSKEGLYTVKATWPSRYGLLNVVVELFTCHGGSDEGRDTDSDVFWSYEDKRVALKVAKLLAGIPHVSAKVTEFYSGEVIWTSEA